jgi:hypothetical protein
MATQTPSRRASLATPKPMPEDPPIMTIDWPEIEGMLTDSDEVLMESSEFKRWISVQVIIDVVIPGISQQQNNTLCYFMDGYQIV